jgi:hypothetical protein
MAMAALFRDYCWEMHSIIIASDQDCFYCFHNLHMFESAAANLVAQIYWDSLHNELAESMLKSKAADAAHALYNTI